MPLAKVGEIFEWISTVNRAEEDRTSFCKALDGKPICSPLYGVYTIIPNKLKVVLKVSAQTGQSGIVCTSVESKGHESDFQEQKRHKGAYQ
jgi:hypothetical protein